MASIAPFTGIRYNPSVVPDLAPVVAPPYDVLSREDIARLHAQSPYNVTHLTRPTAYESAGELWSSWREGGIVLQDRPSMYIYRQTYIDPESGRAMPARTGLICALRLESYEGRGVLPHENTIAAHRADRLELMRTTHANLESIYGLYSDESGHASKLLHDAAASSAAVVEVRGTPTGDHVLHKIEHEGVVTALQAALTGKDILIADGHHRYETALAYQNERPSEAGSGAILITLTAFEDEGLLVLPTHRLVRGVPAPTIADLPNILSKAGFFVTTVAADAPPLPAGSLGFDALMSDGRRLRALLDPSKSPVDLIEGPQSAAWKSLDVTVLHKLVMEDLLQIPMATLSGTDRVRYTRDTGEALAKVESGEFEVAFLLSRPVVPAIRAVSASGDRMPQKSTFFYPKLLSGLVMRSLD